MIICNCTGATDRDVRAGKAKIGRCKGCAPAVKEIRSTMSTECTSGNECYEDKENT